MWLLGTALTAWHRTTGKSRARLGQGAAKRLTKNTREVREQAGGKFSWAENRGTLLPVLPPASLPAVQLSWPRRLALSLSLCPTCTPGKARYRGCEDVPSKGPWGQAEGLSEPSLLLERCLEKEGKAICTAACPCASLLPAHGAGGRLCARCPRRLFEGSCPTAGDKPRQS